MSTGKDYEDGTRALCNSCNEMGTYIKNQDDGFWMHDKGFYKHPFSPTNVELPKEKKTSRYPMGTVAMCNCGHAIHWTGESWNHTHGSRRHPIIVDEKTVIVPHVVTMVNNYNLYVKGE